MNEQQVIVTKTASRFKNIKISLTRNLPFNENLEASCEQLETQNNSSRSRIILNGSKSNFLMIPAM